MNGHPHSRANHMLEVKELFAIIELDLGLAQSKSAARWELDVQWHSRHRISR